MLEFKSTVLISKTVHVLLLESKLNILKTKVFQHTYIGTNSVNRAVID